MKFEQPTTFAQLGEQPLQTRLGLKKGWPLAPGNLDPQFPYGLSVSIPNVILRFQVWHKAVLTSSLRIWAICRFLTTLDSQAWEIAWARIKQESQLELQLCMEHCCSRGWRHGIAHTGEEAKRCPIVLYGSHVLVDTGTAMLATLSRPYTAPIRPSHHMTEIFSLEKRKKIAHYHNRTKGCVGHRLDMGLIIQLSVWCIPPHSCCFYHLLFGVALTNVPLATLFIHSVICRTIIMPWMQISEQTKQLVAPRGTLSNKL